MTRLNFHIQSLCHIQHIYEKKLTIPIFILLENSNTCLSNQTLPNKFLITHTQTHTHLKKGTVTHGNKSPIYAFR